MHVLRDGWVTLERPGYLGKKRDEICGGWDDLYGENNWRIAYEWAGQVVTREFALQLYEDGYYEHFRRVPTDLDWLTSTASDVYDTAPTNVEAGLSYFKQETPNNHIHDVAIRRAVYRHGRTFQGGHLVHVRWTGSEGFRINPGIVPFHLPDLILQEEIKDHGSKGIWWKPLTIEDFYQRNKLLQVTRVIHDRLSRSSVLAACHGTDEPCKSLVPSDQYWCADCAAKFADK